MRKFLFTMFALTLYTTASAQFTVSEMADKFAIKELIDTFSNLADEKEAVKQTFLFTENATVETYSDGKLVTSLQGRKQIGEVFGAFLSRFKTVYHMNGQQTVTLDGNRASGISYCMVTLIDENNGKTSKTSIGVIYNDEYVKENGKWLINKRVSNFTWQDNQEISK